ncbi:MAG: GTPase HflX, partial [Deferribacteraceae bacterium]|nr:GTPase HflX [Deferribacteraceae bacterium]
GERISFLSGKLKKIERTRVTQRAKRKRHDVPVVSIIGYTNAGKSTLLNTLTQSAVYADDRLFATLDTSSKRIRFPQEREVIITDTVGFIRDLPPDLAGAFKSTLEELEEADLLLHVVDASSMYTRQHIQSVIAVLKELGLEEKPMIIVFNKIDLISDEAIELLRAEHAGHAKPVFISARDKQTLVSLLQEMNHELFVARSHYES